MTIESDHEFDPISPTENHNQSSKSRPMISLPFLVSALFLGGASYVMGPWVMTQAMFLQERAKANAPASSPGTPPGKPVLGWSDLQLPPEKSESDN